MPLPSPPRLRTLCALALAFCLSSAASAQTAAEIDRLAVPEEVAAYVMQPDIAAALNLRVSAEPNGFTPNLIGYNMGVHVPGNNVSGWLRYSEINSARHWWSQKSWPAPPARWRNRDQTLDHFNQQRAQLRGDPRQELAALTRIIVADRGPPPPGTLGHLFSLSEMIKNDITPLVQLNHNTRTIPYDRPDGSPDWHGRWTYWRGVYLNAFYLAATYGVERFQLFNEPDHPNSEHISQTEYVRRLQIGSDALHAAIADVNQRAGRNLRLRLGAPVTAGLLVFEARQGRPDQRDLTTGWGELITRHRLDDFPGRSPEFGSLYQVYSFQNYGRLPDRMLNGIPRLRELIATGNGGEALPIITTEMNVSTAANFARTTETLDSTAYYAPFGAIAAAYINAGIDEIYIFRLTQEPLPDGSVKKNGTHYVGLTDPRQNILATTRGAEVARLLIRGFKGARTRLTAPLSNPALLPAAACRDETDGTHYLLFSHLAPAAASLPVDLSAWQLPAGSLVSVEEVSESHHGDVRLLFPLPAGGRFELPLAPSSVVLVTVRPALQGLPGQQLPVAIQPSAHLLQADAPANLQPGDRVYLQLLPLPAPDAPRLQVRVGTTAPLQADVLGQFVPSTAAAFVDITRAAHAARGEPIRLQVGVEPALRGPLELRPADIAAATLHVFSAR